MKKKLHLQRRQRARKAAPRPNPHPPVRRVASAILRKSAFRRAFASGLLICFRALLCLRWRAGQWLRQSQRGAGHD